MKKGILKSCFLALLALTLTTLAHASFYYYNDTGVTVRVHYREDVNYYSEVFTGGEGSYSNNGSFDLNPGQSLTMNDHTNNYSGWVYEHFYSIDYIEIL